MYKTNHLSRFINAMRQEDVDPMFYAQQEAGMMPDDIFMARVGRKKRAINQFEEDQKNYLRQIGLLGRD